MAKRNFKAGVILTGDSKGAVNAVDLTKENLEKLNNELNMGAKLARKHGAAMSKGKDALKSLGSGFASATKLAAGFAVLGAGAAATALTKLTTQGFTAIDSLAKVSDKLGIGTESLAAYRLAAEQSGVASQSFDIALQRLTRRTAEAAAGTGEAQAAFKALGLSASELVNLSPDQALDQIADSFSKVQNQAQRVQIAFKLFDTEGVNLVNTLAGGSAAFDEFRRQAEIAGLAISRETARGVERANDATNLLKKSIGGLGQQLAARSAPFIEAISDSLFEALENFGGMSKVADSVFKTIIGGAGFVADAFNGLRVVWLALKVPFQEVGRAILNIFRMLDVASVGLQNAFISLINLITGGVTTAIRGTFQEVANLANRMASLDFLPDGLQARAKLLANQMQNVAASVAATGKAVEIGPAKVSEFLERATLKAKDLVDVYQNELLAALREPPPSEGFEAWAQEISDLAAQANAEWVAAQERQRTEADITSTSIIDSFSKAADKASSVWDDFGKNAKQAFVDVFAKGDGEVKDFLRRVETSFKEASLRGAFDLLLGGLSFGGSGGGGGGAGSLFSSVGGLLGNGGANGGGAGALAGLLGGIGGLGSLFGAGSGLSSILTAGGLGPSITGGLSLGAANLFGFDSGVSNVVDDLLGGGLGDSLNNIGGSLIAGVVGNFAGGALGEAIFGKTAESSIGSTIGGIAGSFFGPLGTGIGAAIGSLADVAFGGDGRTRSNAGTLVNQVNGTQRGGDVFTGASGLTFQSYTRRANSEASDQLTQTLLGIDSTLTAISQSAGIDVDLSGSSNLGVRADAGNGGAGNFFGSKGFNGAGTLEGAADNFVRAWLGEVNELLPQRVTQILQGVDGTAEELVNAFQAAIGIDSLLDLDVVGRTEQALADLVSEQRTLFELYEETTTAAREAAGGLDGSVEGLTNLNTVLREQKTVAAQLASSYRAVGIEVDALLGGTIQSIRESVLNDEELYNLRREQISELNGQLASAVSPEEIAAIVQQINSLSGQAFNLLDDTQQSSLADEFIGFLTGVADSASGRVDAGLASVAGSEASLAQAVNVELLGVQSFQESTAVLADALTNGRITINVNGVSVPIGIADLGIGAEVNI
tara:strand:+ start:3378 stop:6710 length:3333 start_codon:yes stop_codon:yes gene_type:complete